MDTHHEPEKNADDQAVKVSATETETLAVKLEQCEKEKNEYLELSRRMKADLMNFKKEQEKTMQAFAQFAAQDAIEKFLPIVDSIALALKHVPKELEGNAWVKGVTSIKQQIDGMLSSMQVKEIDAAGKHFDPTLHEAVTQEESETHDGMVIAELQKGYMLGGKVLRAAKVKIGHKKE